MAVLKVLAGLAVAAAISQGGASNMSSPSEVALKAANLAAPQPPETTEGRMQAMGYLLVHKWELFDQNHDGVLSADEWLAFHFAPFAIFNKNRDGHIKLEEFAEFFNGPLKQPHPAGLLRPWKQIQGHFNSLDKGHKGYLTIDDFREEAMSWLHLNDVNRDGRVTEAELSETATMGRRR